MCGIYRCNLLAQSFVLASLGVWDVSGWHPVFNALRGMGDVMGEMTSCKLAREGAGNCWLAEDFVPCGLKVLGMSAPV